jgi:hypothetical protein
MACYDVQSMGKVAREQLADVADRIGIGEDQGLARHRHFPAGSQ